MVGDASESGVAVGDYAMHTHSGMVAMDHYSHQLPWWIFNGAWALAWTMPVVSASAVRDPQLKELP